MADFKYDIVDEIISVPSDSVGWNIEINRIAWGNSEPKYDIRKWSEDRSKMSKGLSLSEDEIVLLFQKYETILEAITGNSVDSLKSLVQEEIADRELEFK